MFLVSIDKRVDRERKPSLANSIHVLILIPCHLCSLFPSPPPSPPRCTFTISLCPLALAGFIKSSVRNLGK
ncbi:hypothetical protein VNO80_18957 [Phaseolus coccineus]|uniref:Uncharacterized protein n=1 Tax=Phaseolus coccineus TaxID=3886 RepID=A0AAN9R4A1_PHACN